MARTENEQYKSEGLKRLRNRVRLESSIVADRLLKAPGGIEEEFEEEFDKLSQRGKVALVTDGYEEWVKRHVQTRFAPVLTPVIENE